MRLLHLSFLGLLAATGITGAAEFSNLTLKGSLDLSALSNKPAVRIQVGGTRAFATGADLTSSAPEFAGQVGVSADGSIAFARGTTAADWTLPVALQNSILYFKELNKGGNVGNVTVGAINANAVAGTSHTVIASGASYTDNVLNLINTTGGYSAITGTHPADAIGTGRAWALGIGPNGAGHAYYNRIYFAANPAAADPTAAPPDILVAQERQEGGDYPHARILCDAVNKKVLLYGWSTSTTFGPVGVSVASDGKVGIGTASPSGSILQVGTPTPNNALTWTAYFGNPSLNRVGIDGASGSGLELLEGGTRKWAIVSSSGTLGLYNNAGGAYALTIDPATSDVAANVGYRVGGPSGPMWRSGTGSPEGVLTAPVGSIYSRTDVGELYFKASGTGNTGWVLK